MHFQKEAVNRSPLLEGLVPVSGVWVQISPRADGPLIHHELGLFDWRIVAFIKRRVDEGVNPAILSEKIFLV